MASKNYEDLQRQLMQLSDRLYEAEGTIRILDDRLGKVCRKLLDCEEMIEQITARIEVE